VHDPGGAAAIPPHLTVVHDLPASAEPALDRAVAGIAPFRVRIAGAVRLGRNGPLPGCGLRVADIDGGLERLCAVTGVDMSTLPHVTILNPRNVRDHAHSERAWVGVQGSAFDETVSVDRITLLDEHGDTWHEVRLLPLGHP
jgi:hypothetical protein